MLLPDLFSLSAWGGGGGAGHKTTSHSISLHMVQRSGVYICIEKGEGLPWDRG